jgi:nicotinamidase-related amidase
MGHGLPAELVAPLPDVIIRTARLADTFRDRGRPVMYAMVPNPYGIMSPGISADFNEIVPELAPRPGNLVSVRPMRDPFICTSPGDDLRQRGVTQICLTGLMTSIGVESAARSGRNYGYNMVFITDAMTGFGEAAHRQEDLPAHRREHHQRRGSSAHQLKPGA